MFTFSNFQFIPNCQNLWQLKNRPVLSIVAYGFSSHLRYLYRFYHSRLARALSFCNEMYHNVFRYEYFTFQTQIYLHKQYIFDTNIIQSEYALLFPFSICKTYMLWVNHCMWIGRWIVSSSRGSPIPSTSLGMIEVSSDDAILLIRVPQQTDAAIVMSAL